MNAVDDITAESPIPKNGQLWNITPPNDMSYHARLVKRMPGWPVRTWEVRILGGGGKVGLITHAPEAWFKDLLDETERV